MADLGNTDETSYTTDFNAEASYRGILVTTTEAGTLTSMSAYIRETFAANTHSVKMALYDASYNLLDESTCRADIGTTNAWYTFTGFTYSLATSTNYYIMLCVSPGSGNLMVGSDSAGSAYKDGTPDPQMGNDSCTTTTLADPADIGTDTSDFAVYLTYTPSGGGISRSLSDSVSTFDADERFLEMYRQLVESASTEDLNSRFINFSRQLTQDESVYDGVTSNVISGNVTARNLNDYESILEDNLSKLIILDGYDYVIYDGTDVPSPSYALQNATLSEYGIAAVAGDKWLVETRSTITWSTDGTCIVDPPGTHLLNFQFYDISTKTLHTGGQVLVYQISNLNENVTVFESLSSNVISTNIYTRSLSDNAAVFDQLADSAEYTRLVQEVLDEVYDTLNTSSVSVRSLVDSVSATDTLSTQFRIVKEISDSIDVSDGLIRSIITGTGAIISRSLVDSISVVDTDTTARDYARQLLDNVVVSDIAATVKLLSTGLGDNVSTYDSILKLQQLSRVMADSVEVSDELNSVIQLYVRSVMNVQFNLEIESIRFEMQ